MNGDAKQISVIDPIGPAIERVKLMLFRPFDLGKWFAVGFCAWLTLLGQGGGNFNFRIPANSQRSSCGSVQSIRDACPTNVLLVVFIVALIVAVGICIWLVLLWLSSRGRFMFLNCVARDSKQIKAPWADNKPSANSLFLFQIVASLLFFLALIPSIVAMGFCIWLLSEGSGYVSPLIIIAMVFLGLLIIAEVIIFSVIMKFTHDFVVPVMYIHKLRCAEAWSRFRSILPGNKGKFVLYLLFQIVIGMATSTIVLAAALVTCCCACCVFAIPYIGTVALLPLLVFGRAYSLCYLRQYGDEFDVFAEEQTQGDSGVNLLPA